MRRPRAGFTLLEAIVAVAIGMAFIASLSMFVRNLGDARLRLNAMSARIDATESLFTLCEQALSTAVVGSAGDPGISGDMHGVRIRFASIGLDELDGGVLGGMREVEVAFSQDDGRLRLRRGSRESTLEVPLRAFEVRYLGSDGWLESFDSSEQGGFPAAIELALWFGPAVEPLDASVDEGVDPLAPVLGEPDRRRLFRIIGAPRVDPLAARSIREEETP